MPTEKKDVKKFGTKPAKTDATSLLQILKELQNKLTELEADYDQKLYGYLARTARMKTKIIKNAEAYKKFVQLPFWKNCKVAPPSTPVSLRRGSRSILSFVMQYALNARSEPALKRALKFSRAIEYLLSQKIAPTDLPDAIKKAGGLEKLARLAARNDPRKPRKPKQKAKKRTAIRLHLSKTKRQEAVKLPLGQEARLRVKCIANKPDRVTFKVLDISAANPAW